VITVEYLTTLRKQAEAQRNRLLAEANQAVGAIAILDLMLERLASETPNEGST
jgi:hypothetical protein